MNLREAAQAALEAIRIFREWEMGQDYESNRETVLARAFAAEEMLAAALAEPWAHVSRVQSDEETHGLQQTHSEDCWRWHHECAITRIQIMRTPLTEQQLDELLASDQWAGITELARAVERWHHIGGSPCAS